jgi:hypothetical protein
VNTWENILGQHFSNNSVLLDIFCQKLLGVVDVGLKPEPDIEKTARTRNPGGASKHNLFVAAQNLMPTAISF